MRDRSDIKHLKTLRPALETRARVIRAIRSFFDEQDFCEVETPVRISNPALELHIDAEPAGDGYLRTSPELHMKRLLAAGYDRIYQLGSCFRRGEQGHLHHPEFTMLEWYRTNASYLDILEDTRRLIAHVAMVVTGSTTVPFGGAAFDVSGEWLQMTVSEAFSEYAGWDPATDYDADRFDGDLVDKVEPALPRDVPCILIDYPAQAAALARLKESDPRVAERWELYLGGLEIANAYSELTDATEQRERFTACAGERRRLGKEVYEVDASFLAALEAGLPPSGGIALGVDRLVMFFCDAQTLDEVMAFRA